MARKKSPQHQQRSMSIADPAVALMLGYGYAGVGTVSETTALTLSAVWRAVSITSGSIASLPLRSIQENPDGTKERTSSFLDNPCRDRLTPFEWREIVMGHLLLHGNAYLQHIRNGAGALVGLWPVHPSTVTVEWNDKAIGGKTFKVGEHYNENGTAAGLFDASNMTQIMGFSLDGLRGLSPIGLARQSFGTGLAGDKAAAKMFQNGSMVSGLVTSEDMLTEDDVKAIQSQINSRLSGVDNAGDMVVINRNLKVTPWTLSAVDAQFLESRTFSIDEVGRWFGVPPHLLGLTEKSTSWGQGIAEQNRGLARYTLQPWTSRIEQKLTPLLPAGKSAEFDYKQFISPSPEDEIGLLLDQVNSGLLTLNEARKIQNRKPLEGGDLPRLPAGAAAPIADPPEDQAA